MMNSKTRIVVLHLKELIYTGIFAALGILFLILMVIMFLPKKDTAIPGESEQDARYIPGKYTTSLEIGDEVLDVEVVVDETRINSVRLNNLSEAVAAMYPLMEPSLEELSEQIYENQSLDGVTYSDDNKYTSMILLDAISAALEKAQITQSK